jgi:Protein of unknown function (DUF3467)
MPPVLKPDLKRGNGMATKGANKEMGKVPAASDSGAAKVRFNSANLKSSYANFCNATSTREEVVLNFGVSNNWDRTPQDMEIELSHRIVLSPFAAKRLNTLLQKLMSEYESRYGELK